MAASSSSSFFDDGVVVVPHKFEGVFIAKGKNNDAICTKNLVPGEAVNGEELISAKNKDGTETEYRIWNPRTSKLAAAIHSGVNNIWVKPGSHVLYMGDVCGTTVSHLSDLVGPDGLVYAVGLSDVVVNMAEKRSNVIAIYANYLFAPRYRMLLSMVDAICADLDDPFKVCGLFTNTEDFLRAGGHFLVSTQGSSLLPTSKNKITFRGVTLHSQREFDILEMIKLEQVDEGLVMVVGCFRVLDT